MTRTLFQSLVLMAAAVLMTQSLHAQESEPTSSWDCVPHNAFAFIHVDLYDLSEVSSLSVPVEMIAGIKKEINQVYERQIGVRPTDILDATVVIPNIEAAVAGQQNADSLGLVLFSFQNPIDSEKIGKRLGEEWKHVNVEGRNAFVNAKNKNCIFHHIDNTLAVGNADMVQWFIDNRKNREPSYLGDAMIDSKYGQIVVGVNGEFVTDEMKAFVPSEFKPLANVDFAAVSLDLFTGFELNGVFQFSTKDDAKFAAKLANAKIDEGKTLLKGFEADALNQLGTNSDAFEATVAPLMSLAGIRYGNKMLDKVEVTRFRNQVLANFSVENFDGGVLTVVGLTAVQAVGMSANQAFHDVANELDHMEKDEVEATAETTTSSLE